MFFFCYMHRNVNTQSLLQIEKTKMKIHFYKKQFSEFVNKNFHIFDQIYFNVYPLKALFRIEFNQFQKGKKAFFLK